jgi:hypothetical protein
MTPETMDLSTATSGMNVWLFVIFFIILFWLFGNNRGFGGFGGVNADPYMPLAYNGACRGTSNCEVEKQQIATTAQIRYDIETQNRASTESINGNINAKFNQIQQERIFDLKMENMYLKGQIADDARYNALTSRLDALDCSVLKQPKLAGLATACPAGAVVNSYSPCGSCNGSVLV